MCCDKCLHRSRRIPEKQGDSSEEPSYNPTARNITISGVAGGALVLERGSTAQKKGAASDDCYCVVVPD